MLVGVLDQSPVRSGGTPADAVHETIELARAADRWGFHRYWLAEHHSTPGLAGASPEVLIAQVAAITGRIRVGSGGIMLPHYSALKVAEQFRMLETLHPGRIDLGIGRAPGSDQRTARILRHGPGALGIEHYPRQIQDLVAFLHDDLHAEHPWRGVHAMPAGPSVPEVWLLGSSDESALLAAQLGQSFCFAHFINEQGGAEVTRAYRERFCASPDLAAPRSSVAVFAVCAETEAQARRLARSRDLFIVRLYTGRPAPYPSVEEAESYPYNAQEVAIAQHAARRSVVGTPEQVHDRLLQMVADYQADELIVVTITHDFKARMRSYELLAEAFDLPGRTT
jgi:luciferase family oxidoreductase group 1